MSDTLADKLAAIRAKSSERLTGLYDRMVNRLIEAETAARALKGGDVCPEFALPTAEGRIVRTGDLFETGPVVFSFYRGVWCPFCSVELEALHEVEADIRRSGARLVAITPEASGLALKVKRERKFEFDILCDLDNGVALSFGLVFRVSDELRNFFTSAHLELPLIYDNSSWFLPIPATYIVARNGVIAHAYVNPDFRERLDSREIVNKVSKLS